ncbi:MAG TPA: response regulator [Candidatus Methylacidiphilales bacterium]
MKLLVVDDMEAVGMIIAQIVAQGGWQSLYRPDSKGIVDLVRDEKVDVLLIDYFMPDRLGLDAVEELRGAGFNLPVILFSGDTGAIDMERAGKLNILKVLGKPLSISELRSTISLAKKALAQQSPAPGGGAT